MSEKSSGGTKSPIQKIDIDFQGLPWKRHIMENQCMSLSMYMCRKQSKQNP